MSTTIVTFRTAAEIKAALESVAKADARPVSSLINKIVREWLVAHGEQEVRNKQRK